MSTGYKEGNDAYKSGGGGSGGGITGLIAGPGIAIQTGVPATPQIDALVRAMYGLRNRLESADNTIEFAKIGNVISVPDGGGVSPGPGWDTCIYKGSSPAGIIYLQDTRIGLQTLYGVTGGIPFLVINQVTATFQVNDNTGTFNGVAGPYILPPGSSLLMVTDDSPATNWLCQQIGPIQNIVAGSGISINFTNPAKPVVTCTISPGGQVNSIQAGPGIAVNNANPASPIVSATGGGPGAVAGLISMPLATCRNAVAIPGVNNAGSLLATLTALSADVTISKLGIWIKQAGSGLITLGVYNSAGVLLAKTASFAPSSTGYQERAITTDGAGGAITSIALTGNNNYYLAVHGNQASNGAQYYGQDVGTTFGPTPWLGWGRDNIATMPNSIGSGSENAQRFMMVGRA
jgi:hypothetical protein